MNNDLENHVMIMINKHVNTGKTYKDTNILNNLKFVPIDIKRAKSP